MSTEPSVVSQDYSIHVMPDKDKKTAADVKWSRVSESTNKDRLAGVYCLRTNIRDWSQQQLWETYTILTEFEATFRSMKSESGLRPVYHPKENRVIGHLFIAHCLLITGSIHYSTD